MSNPSRFAFVNVTSDRFRPQRQDVFDEAAGGNQDVMRVAEVKQFLDRLARHQTERSAGKLEHVHVAAHRR